MYFFNQIIEPLAAKGLLKYQMIRNNSENLCLRVDKPYLLEAAADWILTPAHYLFAGRTITHIQTNSANQTDPTLVFEYLRGDLLLV